MSVWARLAMATCLVAAGLAGHAAKAEIFDHISMSATPSTYDGPCPLSIKLESVIKFEISFNRQEQYVYRWEANDNPLTDDAHALSKGRSNQVEDTIEVNAPIGKTKVLPIRLHAMWGTEFAKTALFYGRAVNDHYSSPVNVTFTCR